MSKFFKIAPGPKRQLFDVVIRLEDVAVAFLTDDYEYDIETTETVVPKPWFRRWFSNEKTETIERTERTRVWLHKVAISSKLTNSGGRSICIAMSRDIAEARAMLAELQAALEAA